MKTTITLRLTFILCLWCCLAGNTQVPYPEWERNFGGTGEEAGYDIQQTPDEGFIVVGYSTSSNGDVKENKGLEDFWVVKLNKYGFIQWEKTYGGTGIDVALSVQVLPKNGGYLVFGVTNSKENTGDVKGTVGNLDWWLLVIDVEGKILDQFVYGGLGEDRPAKVFYLGNDDIVMLGTTFSKDLNGEDKSSAVRLIKTKLNALPKLTMNKPLFPPIYGIADISYYNRALGSARQTSDHGFIICGTFAGIYSYDYFVLKIDASFNVSWWKLYGDKEAEAASDVIETKNGEYLVIGDKYIDTSREKDCWLLRLDKEGKVLDSIMYGGIKLDNPNYILRNQSGEIIFCGSIRSENINAKQSITNGGTCWVASLSDIKPLKDSLLWSGHYGSGGTVGYKVIEIAPNQLIVVGGNYGSLWLAKLNPKCMEYPSNRLQPTIGSDILACENSQVSLTVKNSLDGVLKYHWFTPNNSFDTTTSPSLSIQKVTSQDTGYYQVMIEQNGCLSRLSPPVKLSIKPASATAETIADFNSCSTDAMISANAPNIPGTTGVWKAFGPQKIESPTNHQTKASNLQPGENRFVWSLSNTTCGSFFSSDTLIVTYLNRTQINAIPDRINMPIEADNLQFDVLTNDQYSNPNEVILNITTQPNQGTVLVNGNKIFYQGFPFSREPVTFTYKLCDLKCPDNCSSAQVTINKQGETRPPNRIGFTPNRDGKNDRLVFEFLNPLYQYPIIIFNRWGKIVYENQNYRNNWDGKLDGKLLPVDTYYYILKNSDTNEKYEGSILLKY